MKTFAEHLRELKHRLAVCLLAMGTGSLVGFVVHKPIETFLQKPLNQTLYYTTPAGGLSFVMQISLGVGVLLSLPLLIFQLVQFARPAVKPIKTRPIVWGVIGSLALTALAVVYAYKISLPAALHFLTTFNSDGIKALIGVNEYLRFLFAYLAGTVVAFQLPLIMYFANKIRRFPPGSLLSLQRPAIVGSIVFAGVITPTVDPINQLLVAAPLIALFELGAVAVWSANRRYRKRGSFEIKQLGALAPSTAARYRPQVTSTATVIRPVQSVAAAQASREQTYTAHTQPKRRHALAVDMFVAA